VSRIVVSISGVMFGYLQSLLRSLVRYHESTPLHISPPQQSLHYPAQPFPAARTVNPAIAVDDLDTVAAARTALMKKMLAGFALAADFRHVVDAGHPAALGGASQLPDRSMHTSPHSQQETNTTKRRNGNED
jgi:hypothetical protein